VTVATRELTTHLFFREPARGATSEFATLRTREESSRSKSLQYDRHRDGGVATQCAMCRVERVARKHAVARVTAPPIDHEHAGPTRRHVLNDSWRRRVHK
jgi:hypothetical protein